MSHDPGLRRPESMEISVLGATGTAGRATVAELMARGHQVRALSRTPPPAGVLPAGAEHRSVDISSGAGLPAALDGADVVIDCLNAPPKGAGAVLVDGVRRALGIAARAGAGHRVTLSIVGIDRVPGRYYATKLAQEAAVGAATGLGTSIVRATQFPQLLDLAWTASRRAGVIPAPRGPLAPVDPRDVAVVLAEIAERGPGPRVEIGGPEARSIAALARAWRRATGTRRPVVPVWPVNAYLRAVAGGGLLAGPGARRGTRTFAGWLSERPDTVAPMRDRDRPGAL